MNIVANAKPASFFDDIPPRAMLAVQLAWGEIRTPGNVFGSDAVYNGLCISASQNDFPPPAKPEFMRWFKGVRAGDIPRPGGNEIEQAVARLDTAEDRLRKAHAIVLHAVKLQQAKIDAGYGSECTETEDEIVALAIKEWLGAAAIGFAEDMGVRSANPAELASLMLTTEDRDQNAKLLDIFATHMQRELCLAIAARSNDGGAA